MNAYRSFFYPFSKALGRFVFWLFGGYSVEGAEHIPLSGGVILAGNHLSTADPMAMLIASPRIPYYMAASNLFEIPGFRALIRFMQAFPVKRGEFDPEAIASCRRYLHQGEAVVMYPEGVISRDGYLGKLYSGAVLLAIREKCPIVPCLVTGTDKLLPVGAWFFHYSPKLSMRIGPALYFDKNEQGLSLRQRLEQGEAELRRAYIDLGARIKPAE